MASIRKSRGQPRVFTDNQNAALHAGLRELQAKRKLSQAKLGELLGISQQTAGKLEKSDTAGFSNATAAYLVRALGYSSPETFFRAKGVGTPSELPEAKSA